MILTGLKNANLAMMFFLELGVLAASPQRVQCKVTRYKGHVT